MREEKMDRSATHVPADVGRSYWVVTDLHTFKTVGEDTGGAFALLRGRAEVTPRPEYTRLYESTSPPRKRAA